MYVAHAQSFFDLVLGFINAPENQFVLISEQKKKKKNH